MSYSLGSATIVPGVKGTFTAVNSGIQGIVVGNISGYSLSVQLEGGATAKTLYPGTADFFPWFIGFSGVIFWTTTSTVNVQNIPGASITFDAIGKIENFNSNAYPMSIAVVQSVNPTATGNPAFSTSFGVSSSAGNNQSLNIFNPPNSGANCTFNLAQAFTNSAGVPTANLIYLSGADLNFSGPATAKSHTGATNPPTSVCHVTTDDSNSAFGGVAIRVVRLTGSAAMATSELLPFPSVFTLTPGGNLRLSVADTTAGHVVEINLDWTENQQIPQPNISGGGVLTGNVEIKGNLLVDSYISVADEINLRQIGCVPDATPTSGTDNTALIQNAINSLSANGGGYIKVPYSASPFGHKGLTKPNNVGFKGDGYGGTGPTSCLLLLSGSNVYSIIFSNGSGGGQIGDTGMGFYDIKFDGNNANQTAGGCVDANGAFLYEFIHCWFANPYESGLKLHNGPGGAFGFQNTVDRCQFTGGFNSAGAGMGLWTVNCDENHFSKLHFQDNGGASAPAGTDQAHVRDENGLNGYDNCDIVGNGHGNVGIKFYSTNGSRVINTIFDGVRGGNIVMSGSKNNEISTCKFLNIGFNAPSVNSADGIYMNSTDNSIVNCYFNPAGDVNNGCKAQIEIDATGGADFIIVQSCIFAAINTGGSQILTDGTLVHSQIGNNLMH